MHKRVVSPVYLILPLVMLLTACGQAVNPVTLPIISPSETSARAALTEISPTISPTQISPTSSPAPTDTPTPIPSPTSIPASDIAALVVASGPPKILQNSSSPDGSWRAHVVRYDCHPINDTDEAAFEQIRLIHTENGSEQVIDEQLVYCSGLGAFGLGIEFWSADSRYLYYTNAREGGPDGGCRYWERPLVRLDTTSREKLNLSLGPLSPDRTMFVTSNLGQIAVWSIDRGELWRVPYAKPGKIYFGAFWAPDSRALVYLLSGNDCGPAKKISIIRLNLADGKQVVIGESREEVINRVEWETPHRLALYGSGQKSWTIDPYEYGPADPWMPPAASTTTLATLTATPIPTLISPTPADTRTPISSPTIIPYPLPTVIPKEAYPSPLIEHLETHALKDGSWTIYSAREWQDQEKMKGDTVMISAIAVAQDGTIWFGTIGGVVSIGTGVYRFDGNTWTRYTMKNGLPADEISSIVVDSGSALWFSTLCCGASRFDGKSWTNYTTVNGLAENDVRSSALASDSTLWFGTESKGVSRFDEKNWNSYTMKDALWGNYVGSINNLPDNSLLFSSSTGRTARLTRFDGKNWIDFPTPWESSGGYTEDIAEAPNGDLWFATERYGAYQMAGNKWTNYTAKDGLASNSVFAIKVALDGAVWFGTDRGISRFDGVKWTTYTTADGLPGNWIGSMAMGLDGALWFGSTGAIYRYLPTN